MPCGLLRASDSSADGGCGNSAAFRDESETMGEGEFVEEYGPEAGGVSDAFGTSFFLNPGSKFISPLQLPCGPGFFSL